MIFAKKRQVVTLEEPEPKPISGHILYDMPEYSTQNLLARLCMATGLIGLFMFTDVFANFKTFLLFFTYILVGAELIAKSIVAINKRYFDENVLILILSFCAFYIGKEIEALLLLIFNGFGNVLQNTCINITRAKFYALLAKNLPTDAESFTQINKDIYNESMLKNINRPSMKKFASYLSFLLLFIVFSYFLYAYYSLERGFSASLKASIILLIASTPFALFVSIPFNFGLANIGASKRNVLEKNVNFLYALNDIQYLVCDDISLVNDELVLKARELGIRIIVLTEDENAKIPENYPVELIIKEKDKHIKEFEKIYARKNIKKLGYVGTKEESAPLVARADVGMCYYKEEAPYLAQAADIVIIEEVRSLTEVLNMGEKAKGINRANIILACVYKLWAVTMAVYGLFTPWQVIYFDIFLLLLASLNSARQIPFKK